MSINVNKKTVYIAVSRTKQSYSRFDLQLYGKAAENFAYLTVNNKGKLVISYICIAVYEYRIPAAKISYKPCRRINGKRRSGNNQAFIICLTAPLTVLSLSGSS